MIKLTNIIGLYNAGNFIWLNSLFLHYPNTKLTNKLCRNFHLNGETKKKVICGWFSLIPLTAQTHEFIFVNMWIIITGFEQRTGISQDGTTLYYFCWYKLCLAVAAISAAFPALFL